jgi:SAM-dependent MidA family methyltransferase
MKLGNPDLIRCIRAEIEKQGPISFARFMHQALYHPEHGYYSSGRCAVGRTGDYFTNVSVGPLYGQLLTAQFVEIWEQLGKIDNFMIVEQGAHDGQFARDVLESAQKRAPEFFAALRYRIVEPFPILQDRQSRTLERFRDKVEWRDSLQPFLGVHFSNELLDAMPVRLISGNMEELVDLEDDKFVFVERPISQQATFQRPAQRDAFNQAALDWIDDVAAKLQRGYVVAFDYGRLEDEFQGDVQVRAQHRNLDSPFEQIGYADITMHVDWSSIVERARANGLRVAGFTDQHHFLIGIIGTWPDLLQARSWNSTVSSSRGQLAAADQKTNRALQTLLHPEMLGRAFQVIALEKNIAEPAEGGQLLQPKPHSTGKESDGRSWATQPIHGIGCPSGAKRVDCEAQRLAGFKFASKPR